MQSTHKRILFVDDEPRVLDGLRRMLRSQRHHWDMVFAPGGQEAQVEMTQSVFDVIVSDMRMPGIDGAMLLGWVQEHHPQVVRIVLSGHAEMEASLRAVPIAHQFLSKPCDPPALTSTIKRACDLQTLLDNPTLLEAIGRIDKLPMAPRLYRQLTATLTDPKASLATVAAVVEQESGLSAKVLQLVNSAFFGLPRRMTSVRTAVSFLGINMLKNIVLSTEVYEEIGNAPTSNQMLERSRRHGMLVGRVARDLLSDSRQADDAFVAGLLHDIGILVLAHGLPDLFAEVTREHLRSGRPLHQVENDLLGATHAEIGGYLLGLWGIPYPIAEAVANHHAPARVGSTVLEPFSAVCVADALVSELGVTGGCCEKDEPSLDMGLLEVIGCADRLPEWRTLAEAIVHQAEKDV